MEKRNGMAKENRPIAWLLVLAACVIVLFSALYLSAELAHDCVGENCPVCCQIRALKNTLKTLAHQAAAFVLPVFFIAILFWQTEKYLVGTTLITLKIKLSN